MQVQKRIGRPPKPRQSILSAEQIAEIRGGVPPEMETVEEANARRAADAERKRLARAEKKALDSMSKAEAIQDFWAESLKLADPEKLSQWKARQEYVEALLADVRTVLEGRAPDEESTQDVDDEIRADIGEHGVAGVTVPLLIGKFWQSPELLARLTDGDSPSAVFAKFGVLVAVDDYSLHKWEQFTATKTATPPARDYVALTCSSPTCRNAITGTETVSESIAADYARLEKPWLCTSCRSAELFSRKQSTLYK